MRDGWETARSRAKNNNEWVIIALGTEGSVEKLVVDTKNFIGNFPQKVEIMGCRTKYVIKKITIIRFIKITFILFIE